MSIHPAAGPAAPVTTPTMSPAIEAVQLVKTYPTGRARPRTTALDRLSLQIRTGEVFALLGPNGAGKSTTVRILSTLTRPDSGHAIVAGHDVADHPDRVRHHIGLVSQKPSSAPMMTGRESIKLAARIQGLTPKASSARASELLERFDLAQAADRLSKTYSGGMQRKLDVAVGLVARPTVLFLDEPTTGLDPEARSQMWAEIESLASVDRMTVLLTTHYLDEADHLADRLAIVDRGRVVAEGTPGELKGELHGDGIVIEVVDEESGPVAATCLSQISGLREISQDGRAVRARADRGGQIIPIVLSRLEDAGVSISSATLAQPSLDDVYLRHVGHSFGNEATE